MNNAVAVFTRKPTADLFAAGGTGDWVADPSRVAKCEYVVCTRNLEGSSDTGVAHGAAFLIGRALSTKTLADGRVLIEFAEYAEINVRDCWTGNRNPVAYGTIDKLLAGLDLATLDWKPFPHELVAPPTITPLTIAEAKAGLAAGLGLPESSIEIVVRA